MGGMFGSRMALASILLLAASTCGPPRGTSHAVRTSRAVREAGARDLPCAITDARVTLEADGTHSVDCRAAGRSLRYECHDPCPERDCDPDGRNEPCPRERAVSCTPGLGRTLSRA